MKSDHDKDEEGWEFLRPMKEEDAVLFANWEKEERPYPWAVVHFKETVTGGAAQGWVVEESGQPIGFLVLQRVENQAHLLNVMIKPDHRRQGWATRLLDKVIKWARRERVRTLTLDVDPNNLAAVGLYKKFGFQILARRKHSYPYGEDAFLMELKLPGES